MNMGNGIWETFAEFVLNGGLFGKERGFDRRKEGHIYSVNECHEDLAKHLSCIRMILEMGKEVTDDGDENDKLHFAM